MNLNYGYYKEAMQALIAKADSLLEVHNLVIDFDGEVIIDPESYYPHVPLSSYKFATHIKDASLRTDMTAGILYDSLEQINDHLDRKANFSIEVNTENRINRAA